VRVDPGGKFLFGADYDGGSVSVFPINADGSLGAEKQMVDFGNNSEAHSVAFDPGGKFAFVPTLGLDQVQQLKLGADGNWSPNSPPNVAAAGNSGPRHIVMHPSGKLVFVINETASTLTPYAVSADGKLTPGTTVSSVPQGVKGKVYGQHLKLSPDGHFLYCSNVGDLQASIGVFSVDQISGALTWLQDQPSGGAWPRDFDLDPNGEVLISANRDSNNLAVFKIGADGKLTPLGQPTTVADQPTSVVIRYQ
jgi:6-phosphogluconolactonase